MNKSFLCLLLLLSFLVVGCASSTEEFVDTHYQGYTILRGNLRSVSGLRASKWQHLTDGIAVEVSDPGCDITMQQGEGETAAAAKSYKLKARDHIIWSTSGDFVLKALTDASAVPAPVQSNQPTGQ